MLSKITKKEWYFAALISLITIIIVLAPYLYGYFTTPESMIFSGVTFDQDYSYISMIQQAREGNFLFKNLYTSEDHKAIFFRPLFLFIGLFAKIFHLSNIFALLFFKIIFIIFFIFTAYKFISIFFQKKLNRKICLIILCFSSGFGFITARLFDYMSTDLWVPESQVFASFFTQPHFIFSQVLILLIFICLLKKHLKFAALAGCLNLLLGLIHPFDLPVTLLVPLIYFTILFFWKRENKIPHYTIYASISCLAILYQFIILKIEPIAKSWNAQNILKSPEILAWVSGYGILVIFAAIGLFKFFKTKNKNLLFLNLWLIINLFLLYLPVNFQRRMSEGLHIPLAILATFGILTICNFLNKFIKPKKIFTHIPKAIFFWIVILSLPFTNINRIGNIFINYFKNKEIPYYFEKDFYSAAQWFKQNKISNKTILASPKNGPFISGLSTNKVYLGFVFQTKDFFHKTKKTKWFFKKNDQNAAKRKFLEKNNIQYILWGPEEQKLGTFKPEKKSYLKLIYKNNNHVIYKILF